MRRGESKLQSLDAIKRGRISFVAKNKDPEEYLSEIIGENFRKYREKWNEAEEVAKVNTLTPNTEYPLHLNFELSFGCNYKCGMCLYAIPTNEWGYPVETKKKVSFEKYKEIVDEGVKKGLSSISLNGYNEPLMQQDLVEYIRYAKAKGVPDVFFVTNGLLLDKKRAAELLDSGMTRILFSVDAFSPETYAKVRKEGGYEKVINNILYFLQLKKDRGAVLPITRVSFVRNKINAAEMDDFIQFWNDKVDYVLMQKFSNPFLGHERFEEAEKTFRMEDSEPFGDCFQPFQRMYITNNGDVHPCCSPYGLRIIVGNIFEQSVADIWKGEKMNEIRRTVNATPGEQPENCRICRDSSAMKCSDKPKDLRV